MTNENAPNPFWLVVVFVVLLVGGLGGRMFAKRETAAIRALTPDSSWFAKLTLSQQRDSIVAYEARRARVPVPLAIAVSHAENWGGDSTALSSSGAVGLMQVMPRTWQHSFEPECSC